MTRPLADWLDQPVQFHGFIDTWQDVPDRNQIRYLFRPVTVKPYGAAESQERHIDHIWFYFENDRGYVENPKLKHKFAGVGRVERYRRRDGSIDYRIDCTDNIDTDMYVRLYNQHHSHPAEQAQMLERILGAIATQKAFFPYEYEQRDIDRFTKETQELLVAAKRRAEEKDRNDMVNFAYRVGARMQKRTQRYKVKPDPVQFKGVRSTSAKGFG